MVRSLIVKGKVLKKFWPEVVLWSIHVLNRSPTFFVQNMTPEEAWSGRKATTDHFKVFGCIAYAHIPDVKRKKLDENGEKCIFLRVNEHSKAYKLFNPITKKVVTSRDVVFDEAKMRDWNRKVKEQQLIPIDFEDAENRTEQQMQSLDEHLPISSTIPLENEQPPENQHSDPISFEEAVKDTKWQMAMEAEINSIEKNHTWELTDLPKGHKTIGVKWVFKTKLNEKGEIGKHKAHLVAKG
ncbi:unnamed protein product [Prunus armeniaca]